MQDNKKSGDRSRTKNDGSLRTIKLSIEEWCQLAKEGIAIPITTRLRWISMEPTIRVNKDPVTFVPIVEGTVLLPGDVVLFERADGAYVCHRVYKILDGGRTVITWGDNAEHPDAPVPLSSVMGLAVSFEKDGRHIILNCDEQRRKGLAWLENKWKRPAFIQYRKLRLKVGDAVRKIRSAKKN